MNRLSSEKSPYLLQHAHNPVDWRPWSEEAFTEAKSRDVPVLLSIGYSTCHWCHVMERESFADTEVAQVLNKNFVCIKVDREQRPDIDRLYMEFCHILTGSGGWPLHIFMTPDKRPFYAFTYLPKENRYNTIGLIELAQKVSTLWSQRHEIIETTANELINHLQNSIKALSKPTEQLDFKNLSHRAFETLRSMYDSQNGGFGVAPKFPMAVYLLFLVDYYEVTGSQEALSMLVTTLRAMRRGGIYDHIGNGFHRYSTDAQWRFPHFEKMLYDQAMLLMAYVEGFRITGLDEFRDTANGIFSYVFTELLSPVGLFYTAQDADTDGQEGLYYIWSYDEIGSVLSGKDFALLSSLFEISREGNFLDTGKNVLYLKKDIPIEDREKFNKIVQRLYEIRSRRNKPFLDTKFLTDCNALMIKALVKAGSVLKNDFFIERACSAVEYLLDVLYDPQKGLAHLSIADFVDNIGFLDDYSYLIDALLELHRLGGSERYLKKALELTEQTIDRFYDKKAGGFYFTDNKKEQLLIPLKDITDNVVPSGSAIMMKNLLYLAKVTNQSTYRETALSVPLSAPTTLASSPLACCTILSTSLQHDLISIK